MKSTMLTAIVGALAILTIDATRPATSGALVLCVSPKDPGFFRNTQCPRSFFTDKGAPDYGNVDRFGRPSRCVPRNLKGGYQQLQVPGSFNCWDTDCSGTCDAVEDLDGNGCDVTDCRGPKGGDGQDGSDGHAGTDGRNGADGRNGVDGRNGADGHNGGDGAAGRNGLDGKDGAVGRDGAAGARGKDAVIIAGLNPNAGPIHGTPNSPCGSVALARAALDDGDVVGDVTLTEPGRYLFEASAQVEQHEEQPVIVECALTEIGTSCGETPCTEPFACVNGRCERALETRASLSVPSGVPTLVEVDGFENAPAPTTIGVRCRVTSIPPGCGGARFEVTVDRSKIKASRVGDPAGTSGE